MCDIALRLSVHFFLTNDPIYILILNRHLKREVLFALILAQEKNTILNN